MLCSKYNLHIYFLIKSKPNEYLISKRIIDEIHTDLTPASWTHVLNSLLFLSFWLTPYGKQLNQMHFSHRSSWVSMHSSRS